MKKIETGKDQPAAISFNDDIEQYAEAQVKNIMNQWWFADYETQIRLMPDVHPGKVGPIGLTINMYDNDMPIMPALLGTDIGCGVSVYKITPGSKGIDFQKLDKAINQNIPSGSELYSTPYQFSFNTNIKLDYDRIRRSFATLGGGNHFIEIDQDDNKNYYLIIHSGSRQYGKQVYDYFMREGQKELKAKGINEPYEMTYIDNDLKFTYMHVCRDCELFASMSRDHIAKTICKIMKWDYEQIMDKPHNFFNIIDEDDYDVDPEYLNSYIYSNILFKGAQSARKNEPVIIPVNMKEGCIVGVGKGNPDWNFAAPHGSGRIYKRSDVANTYTVNQFKKDMEGIYSTSIRKDTLDEAPIAYRSMEQILPLIKDTVEVKEIWHPVYNFKAGKED